MATTEEDVAEQDDRLTTIESNVDLWDDRIIALEVANIDIQDRLTTVEETILGAFKSLATIHVLYFLQLNKTYNFVHFHLVHLFISV